MVEETEDTPAYVDIQIQMPVCRILLLNLLESVLKKTFLRNIKGITKVYFLNKKRPDGSGKEPVVQTEGINFEAAYA